MKCEFPRVRKSEALKCWPDSWAKNILPCNSIDGEANSVAVVHVLNIKYVERKIKDVNGKQFHIFLIQYLYKIYISIHIIVVKMWVVFSYILLKITAL